jgi:hypothetical protein
MQNSFVFAGSSEAADRGTKVVCSATKESISLRKNIFLLGEEEETMSGKSRVTTDHDEIRRWTEERGGWPATVKATEKGGKPGILRIDYPGFSGEDTLDKISWEEFFEAFDQNNLAFLYQDEKDSRFSKLIDRASTKETRSARA